ncbi:shikimate O-hydroxycinnamoyltransferase-like [Citrus clementina]|uniref:Hydroxycinnamoyl-CoA shikimate/quinate hydroxycinnamoyl transferase n=1 Tax=Citrus limon TaxID=2708 RepID=A0A1S8ADI5_CITLI|nr:shikimate O-hydroxycinnamoyltransferase-like [Citrus x clementina]
MEIHIKESTLIRPAQETPKHCLRTSDLDRSMPFIFNPGAYFYRRPEDALNFFEVGLMKEALSKVLVPLYPYAGRLVKDENGEFEVNCNGEGVLFVEAETSCELDDFTDFESTLKLLQLFPAIDHTKDTSFYPLFSAQVTHFKCGGVCVGAMSHHVLADGIATAFGMNLWSEMARDVPLSITPLFDRAVLETGIPVSPTFHHLEYDLPPSMINSPTHDHQKQETISTATIKLSPDQMNTLKGKYSKKYSKFEILAAHIWRCACKARGLSADQLSKLEIPTNGRFKLTPKVPLGYIGNVAFSATPIAFSGEIQSEPLEYTAEIIHNALKRMDDKYLKSALAYLKQQPDLTVIRREAHNNSCPNLLMCNLANMPLYDANFGWGRPMFVRMVYPFLHDGVVFILPSPANDGSWFVVVDLETNHLQLFKKLFYDIFLQH